MKLSLQHDGESIEFECFDNRVSRKISAEILQGKTYPRFDAIGNVDIVLDVGANIGASALYFSLLYPEAKIFAFEPALEPYRLLKKNTAKRAQIHPYQFGLFSANLNVPLFRGAVDSATSSIGRSALNLDASETVELRSVREWLDNASVLAVDILKIDTEGCEVPILQEMSNLLPSIKLIHIEYHSENDRKAIDVLLGESHILASGRIIHPHRGELTYMARSVFPTEQAFSHFEIKLDL